MRSSNRLAAIQASEASVGDRKMSPGAPPAGGFDGTLRLGEPLGVFPHPHPARFQELRRKRLSKTRIHDGRPTKYATKLRRQLSATLSINCRQSELRISRQVKRRGPRRGQFSLIINHFAL